MSRRDFQGRIALRKASLKRLGDAKALVHSPGFHGQAARYLAGYAIECVLKALAMEAYDCATLEQLAERWNVQESVVYTHGLEVFARRLTFFERLRRSTVWRDFILANQWRPSWRYDPRDIRGTDAAPFVESVERVLKWLDANRG